MKHLTDNDFWKLIDGEVSKDESLIMTEHIIACSDCKAAFNTLKTMHVDISGMKTEKPSADFNERVFSKMPELALIPGRNRINLMGLAIVSLVLLSSVFVMLSGQHVSDYTKVHELYRFFFEAFQNESFLIGILIVNVIGLLLVLDNFFLGPLVKRRALN